jgi:glyoxylase-like metal-dependent hydrolase (beta-lactamase superfamily II)
MRSATVLTMLALAPAAWLGQQPPTIHDSYQQARRLVDRAIDAHGGLESLRRARRIHIRFSGHEVWRHQSRAVAPPYDRRPASGELRIDLDGGRLSYDLSRSYPGGIHRHFRFATAPEHSHYVNHLHRTYTIEDYPPPDQQVNNLYYVPQLILLAAHESGTRLRSLGPLRLANGSIVNAIATATPAGAMTFGLDDATHRVRALLSVRADAVGGELAAETEFLEYRNVDGLLTAGRRTVSIGGERVEDFEFGSVMYGEGVPDAYVAAPPGYELRPSLDAPAVRTLADNVWLVGGASASLVVALGNDVLVIDASPAAASVVMSQLPTLLPGKKITYVIPTHHHDDHAPGIRALTRDGAGVLTTVNNAALFDRLTNGRPVQTIDGTSRVFAAGVRSVEIHNIGPSPHANDMLVAWLPHEGILFEADLLDVTPRGTIESGANNDTTMHFAKWLRGRGWRVRQFAGAHGGVIDEAAFEQLLAQPIRPSP